MNKKEFDGLILTISTQSESLAAHIHKAGMAALKQANEFNNMSWGIDLVAAVGHKHAGKRVAAWLVLYGKFKIKEGELVAASKKTIPEGWEELANETPYWEAYAEPNVKPVSLDYLKMIQAILNKQAKLDDEGREYTESNTEIKEELQNLLIKFL